MANGKVKLANIFGVIVEQNSAKCRTWGIPVSFVHLFIYLTFNY